jgi:hypothetical protein
MPAGPCEAQVQFVHTFKARLAGSSPSDIVVHQIPKMAARASPPGSILRTILGAFEGPVTITARSLFLAVRRGRLQWCLAGSFADCKHVG